MNLWNEFSGACANRSSKLAFRGRFGDWSFERLRQRALDHAAEFARHPIRRGDRVIVVCRNHPETASSILACWLHSLIPVLVSEEEPPARFEYIANLTTPTLVVGPEEALGAVGASSDGATLICDEAVRASRSYGAALSVALPTDAASIVFTSASTGKAKGVVQSHGALSRGCHAVGAYLGYRPEDEILGAIPWTFDYGYGQLLSTLLLGIAQVIPDDPGPVGAAHAIEKYRPSVLPLVPSLASYLCRGLVTFRDVQISSVRLVTNTGGRIPLPMLREMFEYFPSERTQIVLNYGLTESYRTSYLRPELVRTHAKSVGAGIPGVEVTVVREDGTVCDKEEVGEVVHRGDYLFMGYWGDPDATERALRPDPLSNERIPCRPRVLFTGDFGYISDEGLLYLQGRKDGLLKCMGVRVSPQEIEDALYSCGMVKEAAVVGLDDEMMGAKICAAVSLRTDGSLAALRKLSTERLSKYMVPRAWLELTNLPKTSNGKPDYRRIRALFNDPSPRD